MTDAWLRTVIQLVFLSQVLLISYVLPRQVLARMRRIVSSYPPATHPRLYPVSLDRVAAAQRTYDRLNRAALAVGLGVAVTDRLWPNGGWVDWDNELLLIGFLLLQLAPLLVARRAGFAYFNLQRRTDPRTTRSADLRPRRLLDHVSPALLVLAGFVYAAFVLQVLLVGRHDYPWFGGNLNIVFMTGMNLFLAGVVLFALRGKRKDPYQDPADRERLMGIAVRNAVWTSIIATGFVALQIGLGALDLASLKPIALSLYFQVLALLSFRGFDIEQVNFEVYREDPVPA